MKRIILLSVLFAVLAITSSVAFAIDDLTPPAEAYTDSPYPTAIYVPADVTETAASVSRIETRLFEMSGKINNVFTKQDVKRFKDDLDTQFELKIGQVLGKMLALLLVWQLFFFATLYISKAKGWL